MESTKLANLANYKSSACCEGKDKRLTKALDTLAEILNIDFGSITVRFHKGRWSPKIEIHKNIMKEIEE